MQVFKFGGASVKDANAVRNVGEIVKRFAKEELLIVISAMGKTTNALELLADSYYKQSGDTRRIFDELKQYHDNILNELLNDIHPHGFDDIENTFIELECLISGSPEGSFDFNYDQIVSFGEIISTKIISIYLNQTNVRNRWIDARNFIHTDTKYREGKVDWQKTEHLIHSKLKPLSEKQIIITQGFIGNSPNNNTTTLGREGSDYSAAIFAYCLDAHSLTIWKDVAGVLNADPKRFKDTVKIDALTYNEAIELAYYGATVIHPKTIQPLQSKNIPLSVKSFINPEADGTIVSNSPHDLIHVPVYIVKGDQTLVSISSKDFSFIVEENLSDIFEAFALHGIKTNLMQNSAISFSACVNTNDEQLEKLQESFRKHFNIRINKDCELFTARNVRSIQQIPYVSEKTILLEQRTRSGMQLVIQ
jgi:aspartate kinase